MRRIHTLPLFALVAALTLLPPAALAQDGAVAPSAPGQETLADPSAPLTDSMLGAWAAVGCGIMVRATIATAGTQVGTIAGAVACCGYMLFDAFVVDPH